ncbi:hypothetical protein BDR26DRAFT_864481 [Obelidium mucronatum]|nr:hypothetical protein BDR26DRAFT_864481 [Obelidium mucronatum]
MDFWGFLIFPIALNLIGCVTPQNSTPLFLSLGTPTLWGISCFMFSAAPKKKSISFSCQQHNPHNLENQRYKLAQQDKSRF